MSTTIGTVPSPTTPARHDAGRRADAGSTKGSFGAMLDQDSTDPAAGKPAREDLGSPHSAERKPHQGSHEAAALIAGNGSNDESMPVATSPHKPQTDADPDGEEDKQGHKAKNHEKAEGDHAGSNSPVLTLHGALPLLIGLHGLARAQQANATGQSAASGESTVPQDGVKTLQAGTHTVSPSPGSSVRWSVSDALPSQDGATGSAQAGDVPDPASQESDTGELKPDRAASHMDAGKRGFPAERVTVLAGHNIPAPAQHPLSPATSSLIGTITTDEGWRQALSSPATAPGMYSAATASAHMLKIELHPAELGAVNVAMRLAGGQLSIEITPHTHEAYRHLSSDTDSIVKSMRDLGFDVGKVSVMQPSLAAPAPGRPDAAGSTAAFTGRDQSSFQPGQSGGNGGGSGGQQSGRSSDHDSRNPGRIASPLRGRPDGGLFI